MCWKEIKINSWEELGSFFDNLIDVWRDSENWYFRGQSISVWPLHPSLLRKIRGVSHQRALGIERGALRRFQNSYHLYDGNKVEFEGPVPWWMIMQHHSCPTRLLDWSESPYVATYFAVQDNIESDGAIWIFPSSALDTNVCERYGRFHPDDAPCLENRESKAIYPILASRNTSRSAPQQGVFTLATNVLADHGELIEAVFREANESERLCKLVIPSKLKYEFLSRLQFLNITPRAFFPDLDGLGKSSRDYIVLRKWRSDNERK